MNVSEETLAAYRNTNYCVRDTGQEFVLRIGVESNDIRKLLSAHAATVAVFITAWNPFGNVLDNAANDDANLILKKDLEVMTGIVLAGYGCSPNERWREDSFLAVPVSRKAAIGLCGKYKQNAVVFIEADGVPELIWHPDKLAS